MSSSFPVYEKRIIIIIFTVEVGGTMENNFFPSSSFKEKDINNRSEKR